MELRGATGELKWSYMTAATFGPWRLEQGADGSTLTGKLVSVDAYKAAQAPLKAVLQVGRQRVTCPILTLQIDGGVVHATLRQMEQ